MAVSSSEKDEGQRTEDIYDVEDSDRKSEEREIAYNDVETKRLLRKVDFRLLPVLTLLYLMSFLDRSNSTYGLGQCSIDIHANT